MEEMIQFNCGHCQKAIRVRANLGGQKAKCPACLQPLQIPRTIRRPKQSNASAPSDLVRPDELLKMKKKAAGGKKTSNIDNDTDVGAFGNDTEIGGFGNDTEIGGFRDDTNIQLKEDDKLANTYVGVPTKEWDAKDVEKAKASLTSPETEFIEDEPDTDMGSFQEPDTDIGGLEDTYTGMPAKKLDQVLGDKIKQGQKAKASEARKLEERLNVTMEKEHQGEEQKTPTRSIRIAKNDSDEILRPTASYHIHPRQEVLTLTDFIFAYFPVLGVFYGAYILLVGRFSQRGRFVLVRSLIVTMIALIFILVPILWYLNGLNSAAECQNNLRALGCGVIQYSAMISDYYYPNASGSEFLTSLQDYGLVPNQRYYFCPGTKEFSYASSYSKVSPAEIGYLGRKNADEAFYIPPLASNESEIVIAADKTHPKSVHAGKVNVLFLDNHVVQYDAYHPELGGRANPFGGLLEALGN